MDMQLKQMGEHLKANDEGFEDKSRDMKELKDANERLKKELDSKSISQQKLSYILLL